MNIAFIIGGLFLLTLGTIGVIVDRRPEPPEPRHGELQVRQQGQFYWTYVYIKHPGWTPRSIFTTIEEAIAERDKYNSITMREKVVE